MTFYDLSNFVLRESDDFIYFKIAFEQVEVSGVPTFTNEAFDYAAKILLNIKKNSLECRRKSYHFVRENTDYNMRGNIKNEGINLMEYYFYHKISAFIDFLSKRNFLDESYYSNAKVTLRYLSEYSKKLDLTEHAEDLYFELLEVVHKIAPFLSNLYTGEEINEAISEKMARNGFASLCEITRRLQVFHPAVPGYHIENGLFEVRHVIVGFTMLRCPKPWDCQGDEPK